MGAFTLCQNCVLADIVITTPGIEAEELGSGSPSLDVGLTIAAFGRARMRAFRPHSCSI